MGTPIQGQVVMLENNATLLGSILNSSITANSNIFSSDLSISQPSKVKIIVLASASASGTLSLVVTSGTTTIGGSLNSGNAITGGAWYEFEIDLPSGVSLNLQYSVSATMTIFVLVTPLG